MKLCNKDLILSIPNEMFQISPRAIDDNLLLDNDVLYKLLSVYEGLFLKFHHISDEWKLEFLKKISCKNGFANNLNIFSDDIFSNVPSELFWSSINSRLIGKINIPAHIVNKLSLEEMSVDFANYANDTHSVDIVGKFGIDSVIKKYSYNAIPFILFNYTHRENPSNLISKDELLLIVSLCEKYNFVKIDHSIWHTFLDLSVNTVDIIEFLTRLSKTNNYDILRHINFTNKRINGSSYIGHTNSLSDLVTILNHLQHILVKLKWNGNYSPMYYNILVYFIALCQSDDDMLLLLEDPSIFQVYSPTIGNYISSSTINRFNQLFIERFNHIS